MHRCTGRGSVQAVRPIGGLEVQVKVKCTVVQAVRSIGGLEVQIKVKCTVVQTLRLCTGHTVHRGSRGTDKGKVHRCTDTEALYRPFGP